MYQQTKECEMCHQEYEGWRFDENKCVRCRQVVALERIADVLEHWVGIQ
jgi:hypothetical protein